MYVQLFMVQNTIEPTWHANYSRLTDVRGALGYILVHYIVSSTGNVLNNRNAGADWVSYFAGIAVYTKFTRKRLPDILHSFHSFSAWLSFYPFSLLGVIYCTGYVVYNGGFDAAD